MNLKYGNGNIVVRSPYCLTVSAFILMFLQHEQGRFGSIKRNDQGPSPYTFHILIKCLFM